MYQKRIGNLLFFQSDLLKKYKTLLNAVSTRIGGVSPPPFDTLNLSFTTGDQKANVLENRRRLSESLGIKMESLVLGKQVHGCNVKVINQEDINKSCSDYAHCIDAIDGMMTDRSGIALTALSADCPLILLFDPVKKAIGLIHGSWRGLVEGIGERGIRRMRKEFRSLPENIYAVISPSIGPCCYMVKDDFIKIVTTLTPYSHRSFTKRGNKKYFNLWSFARNQLQRSGLYLRHIESADICTKCNPQWFYSFRRDGAKTGRFGAIISLPHAP